MFRFISFGSGTSGNCYLLYTSSDALLIDVGVGLRGLKKHFHDYGLDLSMVRHVLVTHNHADHVKSVGSFSTTFNVSVYATAKVHRGIRENVCVRKKIPRVLVRTIEKDTTFMLGDFQVTPFEVPHNSPENVGYLIKSEGVTFCLLTDVGSLNPGIRHAISMADYLVIEANFNIDMLNRGPYPEGMKKQILSDTGHQSNVNCGKALSENASENLKHIWLCHLSGTNNSQSTALSDVRAVIEEAVKVDPSRRFLLDVPIDALSRKIPSEIFNLK
jgi:phosphoribosyl 1,2-cyclic phosphodiesterase